MWFWDKKQHGLHCKYQQFIYYWNENKNKNNAYLYMYHVFKVKKMLSALFIDSLYYL